LNSWKAGRVLVTGAGGFIGSHLVEELVRGGARVRAFLHYNSRGERGLLELAPPEIVDEVESVFGDLRDADTVRCAVRDSTSVFHLGALIAIPYSYASPRDVVETNVLGTLNILTAAREAGVERVLQTSSSEVYGTARYVPIDELHPLQGQSPYAASKIGADQLAESFHRSYGLPVSIVRPFNTFGPRQSARAIIPTVISQALTGSVVRLGSTLPTRDFNFVTDTVSGFLRIADSAHTVGETLNLGTGRETTVPDLIAVIGKLLGRDLAVETDDQRLRPAKSEVYRLVADATKIRQLCDWEPAVSFEEGLRRTVDWTRANISRYRPGIYGV
jgi:NAD dependent epimerase/dehydratase